MPTILIIVTWTWITFISHSYFMKTCGQHIQYHIAISLSLSLSYITLSLLSDRRKKKVFKNSKRCCRHCEINFLSKYGILSEFNQSLRTFDAMVTPQI